MGPSDLYHICSGYLKTRDDTGQIILALVHQAPHLPHSENTLLSEYQIRHFGNLVNSCSKDHLVSYDPPTFGKQQMVLEGGKYTLPLKRRGGTMGLEILPYLEGDDELYPIVELTSPDRWTPERHTKWRTTLHTQLNNNTLNRIVDKEYIKLTRQFQSTQLMILKMMLLSICILLQTAHL